MKTLIFFLALCATAQATPCDDARKDFARAKQFGAYEFACKDSYDGRATSSWSMSPEGFKAFRASETQRQRGKGR